MLKRGRYFFSKLLFAFLLFFSQGVIGQRICPVNIGFEKGSFENWECSIGSIEESTGIISVSPTSPTPGRHTLFKNSYPQALDEFGGFPVNCPNGSGYSIQLGNSGTGRMAERVSYTFTIPPDENNYSIIYNYAVVFQNPNHESWQQPKFTANVFDVTGGEYIGCSSFSYAASSNLPGFKISAIREMVYYKSWTPVTIKLTGCAGKTIRLEFTTNDCTKGGHFGYAYVDVNQNCTSPISGNVYCDKAESITLVSPFGFAEYNWFNTDFSKKLGTGNTLIIAPVPPPGTRYAVEVIPYPEQGCLDTIYTTSVYSPDQLNLRVTPSVTGCLLNGVDITNSAITAGSTAGLSFAYYTDMAQVDYIPTPWFIAKTGGYYIQAQNPAGCTAFKKIDVKVEGIPEFKITAPLPVYRPATVDLTQTFTATDASSLFFTYWQDTLATKAVRAPEAVTNKGTYFIKGTNIQAPDCITIQPVNVVIKEPVVTPPNIFTPNGDGVNDEWAIPQLSYYPECFVQIYDRGGRVIFRSVGYAKAWDGKVNGVDVPVATYYYVIKLNRELLPVSGSITVAK